MDIPTGGEGRIKELPMGTLMEVVHAERAVLVLMEYANPNSLHLLRRGRFAMMLMLHSMSTIIVAACMVDNMYWPLARDSPVLLVGGRSFLIALPGLLYGLWFPPTSAQSAVTLLVDVFRQFSHYEDFKHVAADFGVPEDRLSFWRKAREQLQPVLDARLQRYGHFTGLSPTAVGSQASEQLRAVRMSDATRLVVNSFAVGLLNPTHCDIHDLRPTRQNGRVMADGPESYPTIIVFSNIVEVLQFVWAIAADEGHLLRTENRLAGVRPSGYKVWCFNRAGLACILRSLIYAGKLPVRPANHQTGREAERRGSENGGSRGSQPMGRARTRRTEEEESSNSANNRETAFSGHHRRA